MGSRTIPFDETERCDVCNRLGAFDFMGDLLCAECSEKYLKSEEDDWEWTIDPWANNSGI